MTKSTGIGKGGDRKIHFPVLESAFDVLNNDAMYWAGLLMADGCVGDNGKVTLVMHIDDLDHLKAFRQFIGAINHKILRPKSRCGVVAATSKRMARRLYHLGIRPRKSLTAEANSVLIDSCAFWRGVVDGDGSIGLSGGYPFFQVAGSGQLLGQFSAFMQSRLGWTNNLSRKGNIFTLSAHRWKALKIIELLWNTDGPALSRKAVLASEICRRFKSLPMTKVKSPNGTGVYEYRGRCLKKPWNAKIIIDRKVKSLGYFATESEAKAVYTAAKLARGTLPRVRRSVVACPLAST